MAFAYFFTLLAGYCVLRHLRDQMGIAGGVRNPPWLFTATFVTLIIAEPLYGALVAKLSRARFIRKSFHILKNNNATGASNRRQLQNSKRTFISRFPRTSCVLTRVYCLKAPPDALPALVSHPVHRECTHVVR
jgi:hypothetical protein